MAEVIYVQSPQMGQNQAPESTWERLLRYLFYFVVFAVIVTVIVTAYFLVDNWDWVVTTLTTGFIGWLNPFDNPKGDYGPGDLADDLVTEYITDPLANAWWWPPNWFK